MNGLSLFLPNENAKCVVKKYPQPDVGGGGGGGGASSLDYSSDRLFVI